MVWTIPVGQVAGALAVSFTAGHVPADAESSATQPQPADEAAPPVVLQSPSPSSRPTPTDAPPQPAVPEPPPPASSRPVPTDEPPRPEAESAGLHSTDRLLQPTDALGFFSMSSGASTGLTPYGGGFDFQIQATVGRHLKSNPTFGASFVVQYRQGFLNELAGGLRLQWDKKLSNSFAIYSSTDVTLGIDWPFGYAGELYPMRPSAMFGLGWGVKAIAAERLLLLFRPVGPTLVGPSYFSEYYVHLRWDISAGIGVVW